MSTENTSSSDKSQDISPAIEHGIFTIKAWCGICDCSDDTIKRDIERYNIPVRRACGTTMIDAARWWKAIWETELHDAAESEDPTAKKDPPQKGKRRRNSD